MSKSELKQTDVVEPKETTTEAPKLNRIEEFLKAKASKGQHFGGKDQHHPHGQSQHTKLKERVRRRP
jgi:hypothetical protein